MAVTTNLNSSSKSHGKISEITQNNKMKSNTFLRGIIIRFQFIILSDFRYFSVTLSI